MSTLSRHLEDLQITHHALAISLYRWQGAVATIADREDREDARRELLIALHEAEREAPGITYLVTGTRIGRTGEPSYRPIHLDPDEGPVRGEPVEVTEDLARQWVDAADRSLTASLSILRGEG